MGGPVANGLTNPYSGFSTPWESPVSSARSGLSLSGVSSSPRGSGLSQRQLTGQTRKARTDRTGTYSLNWADHHGLPSDFLCMRLSVAALKCT